ncbi:MAG: helix-turn-helix transcriptional regulator [Heliobacteriaceae bacterium]|jgi:transcriptional regulator with XRE-family HTH domain|nr:helix-turn-helix transcriptional regulator [Heliobacteriaceae bacterium]
MNLFLLYVIIDKMQHLSLGNYTREKRKATGKSLNKFAIEFDIESASLSRFENNKQDIKFGMLVKVARGLGQTPSQFLADYESSVNWH